MATTPLEAVSESAIRRVRHDGVSVKPLSGQEVLPIGDVGGDDSASKALQHSGHLARARSRLPDGLARRQMRQQRLCHPFRRFVQVAIYTLVTALTLAHLPL